MTEDAAIRRKTSSTPGYVWEYDGLRVSYEPALDGDGSNQASSFVSYIKKEFGEGAHFGTCFEWCAGPGFIGFALLAEGICDLLVLADINPRAIAFARQTVRNNELDRVVRTYVSDNLDAIPSTERFDLVVANPPNYYWLNPAHDHYRWLKDDLRPMDRGWRLHAQFYGGIRRFLNPGAVLLIEEVEVHRREVFVPIESSIPRDIRPEVPIRTFARMISNGGLQFRSAKHFHTDMVSGLMMYMMHSRCVSD